MKAAPLLRWAGTGVVAVAALGWLVAGSLTDARRNALATDHLHRIEQVQANISESVLKLRYGLINNYDGVNQLALQARASRDALGGGGAAIVGRGSLAIDENFQAWSAAFDAYQLQLEQFKSRNAVLKNSLQHFAAAAETIRQRLPKDPLGERIADDLGTLQFVTLRYATSSDDSLRDEVVARVRDMRKAIGGLPPPLRLETGNILDHADIIVGLRPELDALARQLVFPPNAERIEKLANAFQDAVLAEEQRADRFRYALGALSALLLLLVVAAVLRLARSARQIQESHRFLDRIADNIGEGVMATDKDGRIVFANRETLRLLGWPREELLGRSLHDTCEADGAGCRGAPEHCPITQAVQRGETISLDDVSFRRRDGSEFPVALVNVPVTEPGLLGAVTVFRDMTEAREKERDLRLAATVFENSPYGLIVTDEKANVLRVNPAFAAITGFSAADVLGQNPRILRSGVHSRSFYQNLWQMVLETGQWKGELRNRRKNGEIYPEWLSIRAVRNDKGATSHYVGIFSDITEHKEAERRLDYLSNYDTLTGLPNRVLFQDRLDRAIARNQGDGRLHAVMFLDLDRFRLTNDTLGHAVGDKLLLAAALRLRKCLGDADTLSRTGGDQYAILLENARSVTDIAAKARELLQAFERPFDLGGAEVYSGISVGIALFPLDAADAPTLLRDADTAMFRAKERGRNNFQFYSADMSADVAEAMRLERGLRRAIEAGEMALHYQPQVALHDSTRVIGVEALLRWHSAEFGDVGPTRFIPIAEKSNLILPIGDWVLRTACAQGKAWQAAGLPPVRIAVNLSAVQLRQPGLVERIREVLGESGLEPHLLELEITESVVMEDVDRSTGVLRELRQLGCEVSIDDFGTGYSSLNYLKHFPVDTLKIDQSFIRNIDSDAGDRAVVNAIISLGESLGLRIVAEGVETERQAECLRGRGGRVDMALQGFHFCRPQQPDAIETFLRERATPSAA